MSVKYEPLLDLIDLLEHIGKEHYEITDTDVRDAIHRTITYYYVWDHSIDEFPISFGMFSRKGDLELSHAIRSFVEAAKRDPRMSQIPLGKARLDAIQDSNFLTPSGKRFYEFFGLSDEPLPPEPLPDVYFEEDDYDES